ncbi:hypothetical protein B0H63DRAFT_520250 [Podospora didyma]|uniref:Uncharacterized protein n=1 Tax=Podospora didyma TaxID=330526 RepID=A0AAE0P0L1_9PEZI|nr:hypothetical protein B0H63DRAFT_520250 [Podospora didyma]
MPSSSAVAVPVTEDNRLRTHLQTKGVKFHIKAGNAKWACTLVDRATHERQRGPRTDSSSSVSSSGSSSAASK